MLTVRDRRLSVHPPPSPLAQFPAVLLAWPTFLPAIFTAKLSWIQSPRNYALFPSFSFFLFDCFSQFEIKINYTLENK